MGKVFKLISAFENKNTKLALEVFAIRLLQKTNINRTEKLLILTGVGFENMPKLYERAKRTLFGNSRASNGEDKIIQSV